MTLLRSFPFLAFVLVLLSIAGLSAAQHSVQLLLVAGTLAAVSWYITEGPRGRTLPRWVSNLLVLGACLHVFVDLFQNRNDMMGVLGRLVVWLTLIKLYERRSARDYAHLLTLSLLLMLTGCLQSNDLLFGAILLTYAALGLYVLLLYQLYVWFERSKRARQSAIPQDYRLVPPLKPIAGRLPGLHFRTQAVSIGIAGAALSVLVFVGFPRGVGANMLGAIHQPWAQRVSQFAWNIDLNTGGRINESRRKVMSVQVVDGQGRVVRSDQPLRLRGAVLDHYEGQGRWRSRQGQPHRVDVSPAALAILKQSTDSNHLIQQRFELVRANSIVAPVFSIYAPVSVAADVEIGLLYDPARQVIRTLDDSPRLLRYTVIADTQAPQITTSDVLAASAGGRSRRSSWFGAEDQRKLRNLAERVLTEAGVALGDRGWQWNLDAATALTNHLQSTGGFTYTTDLSNVVSRQGEDPIVAFLSSTKRGHCEFFASGLAALCQSIGIPVRIVVGYAAYNRDLESGWCIVLESNAHAWVEVQTESNYWTTFDPTPAATLRAIHGGQTTVADELRWAYQGVEGDWTNAIADFDDTTQARFAETFNRGWSRRLTAAIQAVRDWMQRVNRYFYFGPAGYIWMGIVAFALVIAVTALVKLMRRSLAIRRTLQLQHVRGSEYQRMLRHLGFYLDMLAVLKRHGLTKPAWQPPLLFAQSVLRRKRQAGELVREITDVFYLARYGRQRLDRDQVERARKMVQELDAAIAQ